MVIFTTSLVAEETLVSCNYSVNEETFSERVTYLVLRDGDRLFSKYRESESRDFTVTDDIIYRVYEGEKLTQLKSEGKVAPLAEVLDTTEDKINSLVFFGIDQLDSEDGEENEEFKMSLWRAKSSLGLWIGVVAQSELDDPRLCSPGRRLFLNIVDYNFSK